MLLVASFALAVPSLAQKGDLMLETEIKVANGQELVVNVGDADVTLNTTSSTLARVEIWLDGKNMSKAKDYYNSRNYRANETNDGLEVLSDKEEDWSLWSWQKRGGAQVSIVVNIPAEFDLSVHTSDGDILADSFVGDAALRSSDGDIRLRDLTGKTIDVRTSDGDIEAGSLDAPDVSVRTSDGDIQIDDVVAEKALIRTSDGDVVVRDIIAEATVQTSDGDVRFETVTGRSFSAKSSDGDLHIGEITSPTSSLSTSDGSIRIDEGSGDISATSSDGDITVHLLAPGEVNLRTSDGDIQITSSGELAADVDLRGESVRLSTSFSFDGDMRKNSAEGSVNGGGRLIRAKASDGRVQLASR